MHQAITNEQIYALLISQQEKLKELDQSFTNINNHFVKIDAKFEKIDHIEITWSTRLISSVLGISTVTALFISLLVTKLL